MGEASFLLTLTLIPHEGNFLDMILTLVSFSPSHRERAGVRGLRCCCPPALTLTLSQRERGRKTSPCEPIKREEFYEQFHRALPRL